LPETNGTEAKAKDRDYNALEVASFFLTLLTFCGLLFYAAATDRRGYCRASRRASRFAHRPRRLGPCRHAGRQPARFPLYLDEFQNFTTLSLANMLSELRKYRVNLVLAHQYLSQLEPEIRNAILGNAGTIVSFRLGVADADILGERVLSGVLSRKSDQPSKVLHLFEADDRWKGIQTL
jgi:TraM recognition site of TraD and TraG